MTTKTMMFPQPRLRGTWRPRRCRHLRCSEALVSNAHVRDVTGSSTPFTTACRTAPRRLPRPTQNPNVKLVSICSSSAAAREEESVDDGERASTSSSSVVEQQLPIHHIRPWRGWRSEARTRSLYSRWLIQQQSSILSPGVWAKQPTHFAYICIFPIRLHLLPFHGEPRYGDDHPPR